ncbi:class I SAM-dependent methyltransferase [Ellagibacter isourolithinifaciens]|uniref:class I SAM-dependent methyltransferase n=1 Tax=Ellagibacter isourolithinifaciens TaxID=2137581 RepID=UPI003A940695
MDEIAAYFDERADSWDESGCSGESRVQGAVLSLVDLKPGDSVLDLGCGTGVMIPFYLAAQAGKIVAVDVSEKMVERAREKFGNEPSVELRASDALSLDEGERFDAAVIYNAYPHFPDKLALVEKVYRLLKPSGRFVVAHGSGKDAINRHHEAVAAGVSCGLRAASEESVLWADKFEIEALVDTPGFYAFSGVRR